MIGCFTCVREDGVRLQLRGLLGYRRQPGLGLLAPCLGRQPTNQPLGLFNFRRADAHGLDHHLSSVQDTRGRPPSSSMIRSFDT